MKKFLRILLTASFLLSGTFWGADLFAEEDGEDGTPGAFDSVVDRFNEINCSSSPGDFKNRSSRRDRRVRNGRRRGRHRSHRGRRGRRHSRRHSMNIFYQKQHCGATVQIC